MGKLWQSPIVLVVPHAWVPRVLEAIHTGVFTAHQGPRNLLASAARSFYWRSMNRDCLDHAVSCILCHKAKRSHRQVRMPMQLRTPQKIPFLEMQIDIVGPINPKSYGQRYLVTMIDMATKYMIAFAIAEQTSAVIMMGMYRHLFCIWGIPSILYSDNGRQFTARLFQRFCKAFGIKHVLSSPLHKETCGLLERQHDQLSQYLRCMAFRCRKQWSLFAYAAVMLHNQSVSTTTRSVSYTHLTLPTICSV